MGWRIVQITKPCKLSVKNKQLLYSTVDSESLTIPLEDISVLILENREISFNNAFLSALIDFDIVMFVCDFSHNPSGSLFPFHNHSRYSEIAWLQTEMNETFKKRLWQQVVKAKIQNQAEVLNILQKDNGDKLLEIAKTVQSGDAKNAESFAASIYWKSLFGADFNRHNDNDVRNAFLNYGYAIMRGCIARSIVGAGLLPCFGIHHANKLNQFNLVDDMIEPFRAFIDYKVCKLDLNEIDVLSPALKSELVSVLTGTCIVGKEENNLLKACEIEAISLAQVIKNRNISELKTPVFKKMELFG